MSHLKKNDFFQFSQQAECTYMPFRQTLCNLYAGLLPISTTIFLNFILSYFPLLYSDFNPQL